MNRLNIRTGRNAVLPIPLSVGQSGNPAGDVRATGNHADLYEIEQRIGELVGQLANAGIAVDRVFCNLDAGFDGKKLRSALMSNGIVPNVYPNPKNGGGMYRGMGL